jgi:acyl-CoA carboxylase epsilon subunit
VTGMSQPADAAPLLRVARGDPTPEEIAALSTVLAAGAATAAGTPPPPRSTRRWADRASMMRQPVLAGPGAWRASELRR